ncbi:MAG: replication protein [Citrobacter portucalensis]
MAIRTPTSTVMAIGKMNITGNVIPSNWWHHIKLPGGEPDSTAIILLSEIVYWYRPVEVRDEASGRSIGWRKRFHADKLQRTYQSFATQFGFSKRKATDAIKRLRDAGLITTELRTVEAGDGLIIPNVLYIEPVPAAIEKIMSGDPVTSNCNTPHDLAEAASQSDVDAPTSNCKTNTETTTETTTEIKNKVTLTGDDSPSEENQNQKTTQRKQPPRIDYQAYFDLYNDILGDRLPFAKDITDKRKAALKRLLPKLKTPNLDGFAAYLKAFAKQAQAFYFGDNERGWKANVDFMLRESTLVGVREGTILDSTEVVE